MESRQLDSDTEVRGGWYPVMAPLFGEALHKKFLPMADAMGYVCVAATRLK